MRRLRLIADVLAVTEVEDGADNRAARRAFAGQKAAELAPDYFPLIAGAFAGSVRVASSEEVKQAAESSMRVPLAVCELDSTEKGPWPVRSTATFVRIVKTIAGVLRSVI
jgi:hypothetical protein